MTQKLSPAAAREIWAVLAREAKPTQGEKFTDLKDHLFYLLNDLQCRINEDPEAKPLGWWLDQDVEHSDDQMLHQGAIAAIRHIMIKGASLRIPMDQMKDKFTKSVVEAILTTVFQIDVPHWEWKKLSEKGPFPAGTHLVISADKRGVSINAEVPMHKETNDTIN